MFDDSDFKPVQNVLAGDAEAAVLFDALAAKGVAIVSGLFHVEDGFAFIEHWSAWRDENNRYSRSCENEIDDVVQSFRDVIARGLAESLNGVWQPDIDVVASMGIYVEKRCILMAEFRELVSSEVSDGLLELEVVL